MTTEKNIDQQNNDRIDQLLQIRQNGMYEYAKATKELVEKGVKIGLMSEGHVIVPESFNDYLNNFNRSGLEFEWIANYTDGGRIFQYDPVTEEQKTFRDIDQSKLKSVSFISNFKWPTDNNEKRVIVTLNWDNGMFEIHNGFMTQHEKGKILDPVSEPKKLILLIKKRFSQASGELAPDLQEFHPPTDEMFFYNRFLLGFETPEKKRVLIIQPNGEISLWEIK